jgi:hypothetical protein
VIGPEVRIVAELEILKVFERVGSPTQAEAEIGKVF